MKRVSFSYFHYSLYHLTVFHFFYHFFIQLSHRIFFLYDCGHSRYMIKGLCASKCDEKYNLDLKIIKKKILLTFRELYFCLFIV